MTLPLLVTRRKEERLNTAKLEDQQEGNMTGWQLLIYLLLTEQGWHPTHSSTPPPPSALSHPM